MNMKEFIFKNIDTKEKAYWLGFLAADGYVPKDRNMVRINVSSKDEDLMDSFIKFVGGNEKDKKYHVNKSNNKMVVYSLSNKIISSDIRSKGIVSPKSNRDIFVILKSIRLQKAFLLGLYDGDGTQGRSSLAAGSKKTLVSIKRYFKLKNKIVKRNNHWGTCFEMNLGSSLLKELFENYDKGLKRKRILPKDSAKVMKCKCGNCILKESKTCLDCMKRIKKFNVSKKELKNLLKIMPIEKIGSKFKVSGNSIRKRVKSLGLTLPKKPIGFWLRKK